MRMMLSFALVIPSLLQAQAPLSAPLEGEAYRLAEEAYRYQASGNAKEALRFADLALQVVGDHPQVLALKRDLHFSLEEWAEAEKLNDRIVAKYPQDSAPLLFRVYLRQKQNRLEEAIQASELARAHPALSPEQNRQLHLATAYVHLARKADWEALRAFEAGLADAKGPRYALLDAGYVAKRLGDEEKAAGFFAAALALEEKGGDTLDLKQRYGLRRETESLSRTWGAVAGTYFREGGALGGYLPGSAPKSRSVQQGVEFYYQPRFLTKNGRYVQLYAQAFQNLYSKQGDAVGHKTLQGSVGLRAKPFSNYNFVLAAQKLVKVGDYAMDDWLFRAAYGMDYGTDLRPWETLWPYWTLYTESASYAKDGHFNQQLETRLGMNWRFAKTGGQNLLIPHVVLAGDHDNRMQDSTALALGAGLSYRRWFRQSPTKAPASWIELTIQGRTRLTESKRAEGLYVTLSCWF